MVRLVKLILLIAGGLGQMVSAVDFQGYQGQYQVNLEIGEELHQTLVGPVAASYLRYYHRVEFGWFFEKWDVWNQHWDLLSQGNTLAFSETAGPLPAAGAVIWTEHLDENQPDYWVSADIAIRIDSGRMVRLDVTNFDSSLPARIRGDGTLKIKATGTVYGDWNGDQILDATDFQIFTAWLADRPSPLPGPGADLNTDGWLGVGDAALMAYFLHGDLPTAYAGWDF